MTKQEFKERWESTPDGGGITFDDIAKCAKEWGLYSSPKTARMNDVVNTVLKHADVSCEDAE
jgi:hypothetical protein